MRSVALQKQAASLKDLHLNPSTVTRRRRRSRIGTAVRAGHPQGRVAAQRTLAGGLHVRPDPLATKGGRRVMVEGFRSFPLHRSPEELEGAVLKIDLRAALLVQGARGGAPDTRFWARAPGGRGVLPPIEAPLGRYL